MRVSIVVADIMIVKSINKWRVLVQVSLRGRLEDLVVSKCKLLFARRVLIHCVAGIHRTGTLTYSLLRMDGKTPKEAWDSLKLMRKATYEGVGDWRVQLAEKLILPGLIPEMPTSVKSDEEELEQMPSKAKKRLTLLRRNTHLNRGRGIHVFRDLETLHKLIREYC
jgi:hypothetical protein